MTQQADLENAADKWEDEQKALREEAEADFMDFVDWESGGIEAELTMGE